MPTSPRSRSFLTARRWGATEARAALAALASSGLGPSAFAARHGLDVQRLHRWLRKFGAAPSAPVGRTLARSFVELRPRPAKRVEIVLRCGQVLRVTESVDTAALLRLVDALEDRQPRSC